MRHLWIDAVALLANHSKPPPGFCSWASSWTLSTPAGEKVEPLRYYELLEKDVVRFGQSSREYVLLHDRSGGDDDD